MKRRLIYSSGLLIIVFISCGHLENIKNAKKSENKVVQQQDGSVSLKLEQAACYNDGRDPSNNTADWDIIISKPGHFKVWLTSATRDTTDLNYTNSVRISMLDDHLEVNPACDKIIRNSGDVHYPYFRADSYMGSIYVSEPGEYNIQLISEKVIAKMESAKSDTKLISVILTPSIR